jgi:hypothetical protein
MLFMNTILGEGGKVRGYVKENGNGKTLLAPGGRTLGYYLEDKNMTVTPGGTLVGWGDQLLTLLED